MEISVIIPTFNRSKSLVRTLKSFLNQAEMDNQYEIIVSDNNSTDNTKENVLDFISKNKSTKIRYHFEPDQGVHFARNSAAKVSTGRILYFTDDDIEADSYLLKELFSLFKEEPELGVATGLVLPKYEVKPPLWIIKYLDPVYFALSKKNIPWLKLISHEQSIEIYSCHQAITRKAFFDCQGFNPENTKGIWLGNGETGLMKKLREKNIYLALQKNP